MKKVSKVNAVLIELIIVILFFAISSVITIQLFAKSYSIETASSAKTELTLVIENQMDEYRGGTMPAGGKVLFYDESLQLCEEEDAYFIEKINASNDEQLPILHVDVSVVDTKGRTVLSYVTAYERQVQ